MMNGGEQVFTAAETAAILANANGALGANPASALTGSDQGIKLEYTANYNLSGSTNVDEVRKVLQSHDEEFKNELIELLDGRQTDHRRSSYA